MAQLEMVGQDLYLRHTDENGRSHVVEHRVWDAETFLTACQRAANKVNEQQPDPAKRMAAVTLATREDYLKERAR